PFTRIIAIDRESLTGEKVRSGRVQVTGGNDGSAELLVRFLSRPYRGPGSPADRRLLTIALVNASSIRGRSPRSEDCFFQVEMEVRAADGQACFLEYPEDRSILLSEEERSLAFLHRHRKTFAIGHGCAAEWNVVGQRADMVRTEVLPEYELRPIVPTQFPDLSLRMYDLSDLGDEQQIVPILEALCDRYEHWIDAQQERVRRPDFPGEYLDVAEKHLALCRQCLSRMRSGVTLLQQNDRVRLAFRLANRAMLTQQLHYGLELREWVEQGGRLEPGKPVQWPDLRHPPQGKGSWRPFQIAFLLINLTAIACAEHPDRSITDLIWFPTGGGKTEAYLGLTAYTILYRRLSNPQNAGTTVLMRYTLRLLTTQQFERAATLICALEKIREERPEELGTEAITIGLWVGGDATPNSRTDACKKHRELEKKPESNPFVVLRCPWCGMRMGPVKPGRRVQVKGYEHEPDPMTIVFRCGDRSCHFSGNRRLPVVVIDEDIYEKPPALLIGTVDKFAMLPWEEKARYLFGIDRGPVTPPDLIIQDELHLISGPLGSMVGHYETAILELCTRREGDRVLRPKIIASTATISNAAEQCHALYGCGPDRVFLFPPQCLEAGDSFFAKEDQEQPGRVYVGVHAPALPSQVTTEVRVMATLLQAPMHLASDEERDPYWTLVGYFNSLRELGLAATLIQGDIREYLNTVWLRKGIRRPQDGDPDLRRFIRHSLELTSRVSGTEIPEALQKLMCPYRAEGPERAVDICLATNMISVGVDVPRLGLMVVVGQPKTSSEYIQATSRVGRSHRGPGLVVTIYNVGRPRDRSHYERFRSYHASIYRHVEPVSVTPFAAPVRERALHALMVTLVRYRSSACRSRPQPPPPPGVQEAIRRVIEERVSAVDPEERAETLRLLEQRWQHWNNVRPPRYGGFGYSHDEAPLLHPAGTPLPEDYEGCAWPTPSSMRDVDAGCRAEVLRRYPEPSQGGDSSRV
ncbi:MAG: helicase-related protein, partial [Chloroherpetonaceae bacterium]|nr:helicase-related protein [Chloroherpetonaceae bacterium]